MAITPGRESQAPGERVAANLASLNEIVAELVQAAAERGWTEPDFAAMVRGVLRDHSHALGFEFQGERAHGPDEPADISIKGSTR